MCIVGLGCSEQNKTELPPNTDIKQTVARCTDTKCKYFVIWFGGPGVYDSHDKEHDGTWLSYALPIFLLMKKGELQVETNEKIVWCIYGSAYEERWKDDVANGMKDNRHNDVKLVRDRGATNYIDYIKNRASLYSNNNEKYDIDVVILNSAKEFWSSLNTFSDGSINRVWYFGHAANDLWLSLYHDYNHVATMEPAFENKEVIAKDDIILHM